MRAAAILSLIAVLAGAPAADPNAGKYVQPHFGGSPFPPGGEPDLTHVVKVYWSTLDGMTTHVEVTAKGERPTQVEWMKVADGKQKSFGATIDSDCKYNILVSAARMKSPDGASNMVAKGQGTLVIRVHGFDAKDFADLPTVKVRYLKGKSLIGETSVTAVPMPKKNKTSSGRTLNKTFETGIGKDLKKKPG